MPGWVWEYVEETVTADRLDALFNKERHQQSAKKQISFEELKAMFPNGIRT